MADAQEQIDAVSRRADDELAGVKNAADLELFRIKYLGSKGEMKNLMTLLGQVPKEQKPAFGQKVNAIKNRVTEAFEAKKASLAAGADDAMTEDVTEPGRRSEIGNRHILMTVTD